MSETALLKGRRAAEGIKPQSDADGTHRCGHLHHTEIVCEE